MAFSLKNIRTDRLLAVRFTVYLDTPCSLHILSSAAGSAEAIAEELYRFERIANSCGFIYASSFLLTPAEVLENAGDAVGESSGEERRSALRPYHVTCVSCA